jgi:predicted TIM-barrel fold metal-dependent hydrolase
MTTPATEAIIEPDLPIADAHHHLWQRSEASFAVLEKEKIFFSQQMLPLYRRHARYLLDEFVTDLNTGHNVVATVYVEAHAMHRKSGPDIMKSVGEVEFANGVAAMSASGLYGNTVVCAGIVGSVDLSLGDAAKDVLLAQKQAGGSRYRGVRTSVLAYDDDPDMLSRRLGNRPHLMLDEKFRTGFRHLEPLGLSFDSWILEPQLPELVDLAKKFPNTQIIANHVGGIVGVGRYRGKQEERFPLWRDSIRRLAACGNVAMKLGGLGMVTTGLASSDGKARSDSAQLAAEWRPYIETCIEAFGVNRCMFESNYPIDDFTASYPVVWNAFKRAVAGASKDEKAALFSGTAKRVYRLDI